MSHPFDFGKLNQWQSGLTGMICSCKSNGMGLRFGKRPHSRTFTFLTVFGMSLAASLVTWFFVRPCKWTMVPKEEKAEV
jgi:hypothetical protein